MLRMTPCSAVIRSGLAGLVGLLFSSTLMAAVCPPAEPGIQSLHQDFSRWQQALQLARSELDQSQFDPAALQRRLGQDPEDLLAWVREETRWLDHEGSLRGASGVVVDRMGSSLDRSLLLAELLEAAGHQVRLAQAPLDAEALDRLRSAHSGELDPIELPDRIPAADVRAAAERFDLNPGELQQALSERLQLRQDIAERLGEQSRSQANALAGSLESTEEIEPSAPRQHWWVQHQQRGRWHDLDPALPGLAAGETLLNAPESTLAVDALDPAHLHRLTIRVTAEQWNNGRLREHTAIEEQFPASALIATQLRIDLVPTALPELSAWLAEVPEGLPGEVTTADEWLPVLRIGGEAVTDQIILADGSVRPADGEPVQARAMQDAVGALGGISLGGRQTERAAPRTELSAVHIHFTIEAPGQETVELTRSLMDMIGPAGREQRRIAMSWDDDLRERRALAMLGHLNIQPQAAWLNDTLLAWQRYGALIDDRLAGLAVLDALAYDRGEILGQALDTRSELHEPLLALAQMRWSLSPEQPRIALTGLNLLAWFESVEPGENLPVSQRGFDILHNPVAVLGNRDESRQVRLLQGVFDTVLEAWIVDNHEQTLADNTSRQFQQALASERDSLWLRDIRELAALEDSLPADISHHLAQALDQGLVVVLADPMGQPDSLTWWQIDPVSGTTLGYGPNRRGQATEAIVNLWKAINNARSAVGMVMSVWECLFSHGTAPGMQCCIRNEAMKEALGRFISYGFSEYAKVTNLVLTSGTAFAEVLNGISLEVIGGFPGEILGEIMDASANCPD
ncbi:MAG: hypothetical protein ACXIUL_10690 [Wenzhouxiangella sp.]